MRIGFTGTRRGMTSAQQLALTALLITQARATGHFEFHHGDCVGADAEADAIARSIRGHAVVTHPPDDDRLRAHCEEVFLARGKGLVGANRVMAPKAYLERNRDIVNDTEVLVACPETESETWRSGTWSTVRHARRTKKRVVVIRPDGTAVEEK